MARKTTAQMMRDWRLGAGLTQRELARRACVARASISHVETGRTLPSIKFSQRIARALGASLGTPVAVHDLFPATFKPLPSRLPQGK